MHRLVGTVFWAGVGFAAAGGACHGTAPREAQTMESSSSQVEVLLGQRPPPLAALKEASFKIVEQYASGCVDVKLLQRVVTAFMDAEDDQFRASGRPEATTRDFGETLALIGELARRIPPERIDLLAELRYRRGQVGILAGDPLGAEKDFALAHDAILKQKGETDLLYVRCTVEQADAGYRNGKKNVAAELYRAALSYPYYTLEGGKYFQEFRDLYHRAGYGLLNCLRDDRQSLEAVVFIPNVDEELNKRLEEEKRLAR
jgi:hypothetical protein